MSVPLDTWSQPTSWPSSLLTPPAFRPLFIVCCWEFLFLSSEFRSALHFYLAFLGVPWQECFTFLFGHEIPDLEWRKQTSGRTFPLKVYQPMADTHLRYQKFAPHAGSVLSLPEQPMHFSRLRFVASERLD